MTGQSVVLRGGNRAAAPEVRDPRGATRVLGWSSPGLPQVEEWDATAAFRLGYAINVVAYRCIQLRARAAASVPLVAGRRMGDASTINENAAITRLLGPPPHGPAPKLSANKLLRWTFAQKIVTGRRAWEIEVGDDGKTPVAFWPLVAAELRAIPAAAGTEWFRLFHYGPAHDPVKFTPSEVFYGWEPSGLDFRKAESELQAARFDLSLITLCDQHSIGFLRNNAVPAAIVTTSKFPDEATRRAFTQSWASEFGGPLNAGRVALNELDDDGDGPVGDSIDVKVLGLSAKDARLMEQRRDLVREVAMALGTPFSKLDASGRTFDNAAQEDLDWWENTILPDLNDLQDDINMQLAPRLGNEVVWFDLRNVRALQSRRKPITALATAPELVAAKMMTLNEGRADYGLAPVDGGDDFAAIEPPKPEPVPALPPAPEPKVEPKAAPKAEPRSVPDVDEVEVRRVKLWRTTDAIARTLEARWERAIGRLFVKQMDATLNRLTGKRGRQALADGKRDSADAVFDHGFWVTQTEELALDLYEQVVAAAGGQLAGRFAIDFDLAAPWVSDFIDARAKQLAGQITDTTYDAIRAQMSEGVVAGESIDDLAARIRNLFTQTYASRAETVARTEVISAYNGAASLGAAQLPHDVVAAQEWIATRDSRTRSAHASVDGQVVPIGLPFSVGGASMAYPGDPAGGSKNTVNCRCAVAFLTPDEYLALGRSRPMVDQRAAVVALRLVDLDEHFDAVRFRRALEGVAA